MALNIFIDGAPATATAGENLLQACLKSGADIPYFCWHPSLGSVGSCRQCAIKIFDGPQDNIGKVVMACMTKPEPAMRISVSDPQAAAARKTMVEFVLRNHPHDCPVCEVGGECHLQDMVVITGHASRRATGRKRTHRSQNLGPFLRHEMNRCIGCYRCVRFYQDYAGGDDFGVFGTGQNIFFGRAEDGKLASNFAGNLAEVCPTGVFVDKPFSQKFRRKWDMRATPSICPHCAVGCNISLHERDGRFRRVMNRFNPTLNGYFLCDRGRFGAGFLDSPARLGASRDRHGKILSKDNVIAQLANRLRKNRETNVIGVGSPRASLESNFALRALVGPKNFYAGVTYVESQIMQAAIAAMATVPVASLADIENADAALILGQNPFRIAPRLGLALRQAAQKPAREFLHERGIEPWQDQAARTATFGRKNPIFVAGPEATPLDSLARLALRLDPDETVRFAQSITSAPPPTEVADSLRAAKRPVIVAGGSAALIIAAQTIVAALRAAGADARLSILLPAANTAGLACMGAPAITAEALDGADIIILETDMFSRPDLLAALATAASITVLDHIETASTRHADLAVATGSFADGEGLFVNLEGRVQAFGKSIFRENAPPQAWQILRDAGIAAGILEPAIWPDQASLVADMATQIPFLSPCAQALPNAPSKPPSLPHRHSGRAAARADIDVREATPISHAASPYGPTMEGPPQPGAEPLVWTPGWNSNQAILRLPQNPTPEIFLFETPTAPPPPMPATPWLYDPGTETEEMSALAPAIIAWRDA